MGSAASRLRKQTAMTSASNEQVSQASHSVQGHPEPGGAPGDDGAESSLSQQHVVATATTPPPDAAEGASSPGHQGSTGPAPEAAEPPAASTGPALPSTEPAQDAAGPPPPPALDAAGAALDAADSTGPAPPPPPSGRPTDEEIVDYQNVIRSQARQVPYVGDQEPLLLLKQEYSAGSMVFVHKIGQMEARGYRTLRRTAGDGNCFFRGFIFGYLESILLFHDTQEKEKLARLVTAWKPKLVEQGYQELVFEDAQAYLSEQLAAIAHDTDPMLLDRLEFVFRDDTISNMIVMYLRLVTAAEIKRRQEFFLPFILGMYDDPPADIETFLRRHVECMGEESDHIHIVAISEALQVPIRVVYLDRSGAQLMEGAGSDADINCHDFVPEGMAADTVPRVHLLYRPGHFDVLYLGA